MLLWRAGGAAWLADGWLPGRSQNLTAAVLMAGVWGCGGVKQKKKNKKKTEGEGEGLAYMYDACNRNKGWYEWYYRYQVTNV